MKYKFNKPKWFLENSKCRVSREQWVLNFYAELFGRVKCNLVNFRYIVSHGELNLPKRIFFPLESIKNDKSSNNKFWIWQPNSSFIENVLFSSVFTEAAPSYISHESFPFIEFSLLEWLPNIWHWRWRVCGGFFSSSNYQKKKRKKKNIENPMVMSNRASIE